MIGWVFWMACTGGSGPPPPPLTTDSGPGSYLYLYPDTSASETGTSDSATVDLLQPVGDWIMVRIGETGSPGRDSGDSGTGTTPFDSGTVPSNGYTSVWEVHAGGWYHWRSEPKRTVTSAGNLSWEGLDAQTARFHTAEDHHWYDCELRLTTPNTLHCRSFWDSGPGTIWFDMEPWP